LLHVFTTGIEPAWLGTSELANDNSSIVIYPNPTKNELHIQNNGLNVELIEIRDINGKVVMSLTSLENISLENLDAGMYFVQVKFDKDNLVQQKLIKE
jgi:hypothetical protein